MTLCILTYFLYNLFRLVMNWGRIKASIYDLGLIGYLYVVAIGLFFYVPIDIFKTLKWLKQFILTVRIKWVVKKFNKIYQRINNS